MYQGERETGRGKEKKEERGRRQGRVPRLCCFLLVAVCPFAVLCEGSLSKGFLIVVPNICVFGFCF